LSYPNSPLARLVSSRHTPGEIPEDPELLQLEFTGIPQGPNDGGFYRNKTSGRNEYMVHKEAAKSFKLWIAELDSLGIPWNITSAYRRKQHNSDIKGSSKSAHLYGGAVDFGNLHGLVGGSKDITTNFNARVDNPVYEQIASVGKKYGWYNPWRLSDNAGTMEEIWHFEYWGPVGVSNFVNQLENADFTGPINPLIPGI